MISSQIIFFADIPKSELVTITYPRGEQYVAIKQRFLLFYNDLRNKKASTGENIDALDGVRGLAVLIVMASHTNFINLQGQGGVGVWLFFVLSGFLLSTPFVKNRDFIKDKSNVLHFFTRRLKRIIPMYYFVILFLLLPLTKIDSKGLLEHLIFIRADGHLWSLPQELLFYVTLPFLMFLLNAIMKNKLAFVLPFLLLLAFGLDKFLTVGVFSLNGNGKSQPFYISPFIIGVLFSYVWHHMKQLTLKASTKNTLQIIGFLFVFVLLFTARFYKDSLNKHFHFNIYTNHTYLGWDFPLEFALLCGLLIICVLLTKNNLLNKVFSFTALRAIGIVGYSMYLIHPFVIEFLIAKGLQVGNQLFFSTLLITYLLSCVTYGFIERSFMRFETKRGTKVIDLNV